MTLNRIQSLLLIFFNKMTTSARLTLAPIEVRGMKILDREKFLRNVQIPVLKVPQDKLSKISRVCKQYFLKLEHLKPVQSDESDALTKYIYMNPEKILHWTDIFENDQKYLIENDVNESNFITKEIQITYDNWKMETIFKAVLPEGEEIVSGFSQIGHIIHLNLRDHLLEYRSLIGQVLIDKIKTCRTVINKSNIIDNTYRNFNMEVIAGDEDFLVTVKENCCNFHFDFSKVYWNSRLGKEHERILEFLKPGDILFDIFCGVGPFSIPAAKKKCKVFANDLNPESFKWLNHNAKSNKVNMSLFKSYNLDGKDFICNVFKDYILECCKGFVKQDKGSKIHVTMNLPAIAVEFLKYFKGLINNKEFKDKFDCEIIVYVYCFVVGEDPVSVAKNMVNDAIGFDMSSYIVDVFDVRNVAPKKEMLRVTLNLRDIIFDASSEKNCEPPLKKLCVE